jgi:hypothetical protein
MYDCHHRRTDSTVRAPSTIGHCAIRRTPRPSVRLGKYVRPYARENASACASTAAAADASTADGSASASEGPGVPGGGVTPPRRHNWG